MDSKCRKRNNVGLSSACSTESDATGQSHHEPYALLHTVIVFEAFRRIPTELIVPSSQYLLP